MFIGGFAYDTFDFLSLDGGVIPPGGCAAETPTYKSPKKPPEKPQNDHFPRALCGNYSYKSSFAHSWKSPENLVYMGF